MQRHTTSAPCGIRSRRAGILFSLCAMAACLCAFVSCTNIDCPLSNSVAAKYVFYSSAGGGSVVITDTVTVRAASNDTILYNLGTNLTSLDLPMSYNLSADTLLFVISKNGESRTDTVVVEHTNKAHFESIDCSASMFHTVTAASVRQGTGSDAVARIDSVVINNPNVNYNEVENFKVFVSNP